jgi:hypothetical protein
VSLAEALSLADEVKPQHRASLDKLHGSAAGDFSAGVTTLAKSYSEIGDAISEMQTRIERIAVDVHFLKDFTPNSPIRRAFHS